MLTPILRTLQHISLFLIFYHGLKALLKAWLAEGVLALLEHFDVGICRSVKLSKAHLARKAFDLDCALEFEVFIVVVYFDVFVDINPRSKHITLQ